MIKLFDNEMNEIEKSIIDYQYDLFPLDNFSSFGLIMDGKFFPTSEHAFQYLKFEKTNPEVADMIRNALSPYEARDIAHTYKDTRDPNWSNIKYQVMEKVIKLKAEQNPMVKEALFKTKDYVIGEMCIDEDTDWGLDRDNNGENHLGKALMNVRKELIKVKVVSIFKDEYEEKIFSDICKKINYGSKSNNSYDMISLEEYIEHLLGYYRYPIDGLDKKRKERERFLKPWIKNNKLEKIINDTYDFAKDVLKCDTLDNGYCRIDVDDDKSFGIDLLISGGGYSDYIIVDNNNRYVSDYIMRRIFGKSFQFNIECDEIERETEDEDILSFDHYYYIYMQGFPKNIKEIKENMLGKAKVLKNQ